MRYLIKPLTKKMLLALQHARQIELNGIERRYCIPEDFKGSLAGLYSRGLVACKDYVINQKTLVCIYVTEPGIDLLKRFEEHSQLLFRNHFTAN